jgi:hypothetical protein
MTGTKKKQDPHFKTEQETQSTMSLGKKKKTEQKKEEMKVSIGFVPLVIIYRMIELSRGV